MDRREQKKWKRKLRQVSSSRPQGFRDPNTGEMVLEPKGFKGIEYSISADGWARNAMIQNSRRKG